MKTIVFLILSGLMLVGLSSVFRYSYAFQTGANSAVNENRLDSSRNEDSSPTIGSVTPAKELRPDEPLPPKTGPVEAQSKSDNRGPGIPLFDFEGPEPAWYTVNDDVMGGVSESLVTVDTNTKRLSFSGDLSLDNNGGFASTRSQWTTYNLDGFDGIALRVRGDGNTYRFRIRTEQTGPEIAYTSLFTTQPGIWQEVYIPFSEMVPLYRGFVVNAAGALNPESIRSFGLMLSDKQEGTFSLEVDWINAVAENKVEIRYANNLSEFEQVVDSVTSDS
jgi:monofunctional biosynthetic peptidoglycan transglycosylase